MNTCQTCKHWTERTGWRTVIGYSNDVDDDEVGWGKRDEADMLYRECSRVAFGVTLAELPQPAIVADGSGYFAALFTVAEFGCTSHEPLESA